MALARAGYHEFLDRDLGRLPGIVVISGREHALADDVVRRILAATFPDEQSKALNLDVVDATQLDDFAVINEKLATFPFLTDRRALVLRQTIELRNDDRADLQAAVARVDGEALLLIDDSGEPRAQRGKAPKDKVESWDFTAERVQTLVVDCTLDQAGRERYIETRAKELGIQVDAGARRYLAAFESVDEIKNALDRLALTGKRISKAAAEEYVRPPGDPKLWDLGNAVGTANLQAALRLLREVAPRAEDATGPLIWLAGDAQIAWELSNGATPQSWSYATGQSAFRAMKLWDLARRRSPQQARDNVRLTMRALEDSLTGKRLPDQALEEVIIRLCTQK